MKTDQPNIIYLQDEDVNDNYEGVTWCFHKIDDNDSKYIKADYLKDMIDEIDHLIDCADNASGVADEFKAMGCTCGRDRFIKELRSKL